jgi:hypothetical protein
MEHDHCGVRSLYPTTTLVRRAYTFKQENEGYF